MADKPEQPAQAVADDGCPQVADVHRLGHVWPGVVDNHGERVPDRHHALAVVVGKAPDVLGQCLVGERDVDEAGPRHLEHGEPVGSFYLIDYRHRYLAGRPSRLPGGGHCPVDLKLPQFGPLRDHHAAKLRVEPQLLEGGTELVAEPVEQRHLA